ncbi:MAG: DNA primase [Candidatus Omnitrophota bacterium]|nr:DNA primase [Candidatus Omnitrophota bacterium]
MGRIPQETIDQILDRLDIVEVVSDYIQLKRVGKNFKACCPFHNEKTPSFIVSPDKQIYHCFGCGAGGNAIGFVMKHENMDFIEAVEALAAKASVELPKFRKDESPEDSLGSRIYEMNKVAATFYQNFLRSDRGRKALEYLRKRGVNAETLTEFRIGYVPDEWDLFRKYCEEKKMPADILRKAGLTIKSEKGRGDYDRFRNRIIFPIFNERGNIVAFGGRVMDQSLPKYINSPETLVYNKSNVLYGLNFSKKGIREADCAVIVEGYMDVIIPYQHGVRNIVATSGTALTPRQVRMLKKYTDTAVMVFDADQAGETASLRGLDILVAGGINVRIATLPEGEDPDSFVRKYGREKLEGILGKAKGLFDYKLDLLVDKLGERDIGGIVDEMLPTISKVDNAVIQSDYLKKLAERLGIHEASLRYEMGKVKPDYSYHYETEAGVDTNSRNYRSSEIHLLGLAISDCKMFDRIRGDLGLDKFRDPNVKKVMMSIQGLFDKGGKEITPGKLLSRFENDEQAKSAIVQAVAKADITEDHDRVLTDCVFCVRKENWEDESNRLALMMKNTRDADEIMELARKVKDIKIKLNSIHNEKVA